LLRFEGPKRTRFRWWFFRKEKRNDGEKRSSMKKILLWNKKEQEGRLWVFIFNNFLKEIGRGICEL